MKYLWLVGVVLMAGCSKAHDKVRSVLEGDGYTQIAVSGFKPFACDEKDTFSNGFVARKAGRRVTGVVCSGWLKGYTIRIQKSEALPPDSLTADSATVTP